MYPPCLLPAPAESLQSLLHLEFMDGDNQYSCEFCAKKVRDKGSTTQQYNLVSTWVALVPPVKAPNWLARAQGCH
jgi:hypothetical protein